MTSKTKSLILVLDATLRTIKFVITGQPVSGG